MENLKFATMFPEQANSCLTLAGGDKDTERLAAVGSLFGQFIYSNRVGLLENSSLMKKGPSNIA